MGSCGQGAGLGFLQFFCLIAVSLCVLPPLDRHEGVLGSVLSANVAVIKVYFCGAGFFHVGKDVEPCGYYLEQAGLNGLLLIV